MPVYFNDLDQYTNGMTMVSRFKLRQDVWERIFSLFEESLLSIKDKEKFDLFLDDFLSPTEKIMFAKRFAIAVLLAKGNSYQEIKNLLKVTSATISKVSILIKYKGNGLNKVIGDVLNKDAGKIIWEEIKSILDVPIKSLPISEYHKKVAKREKTIQNLKSGI